MQSDDYHLDRALYYACREDRDRLCAQVTSGNGRVYRCLYEKKFDSMMSAAVSDERRKELFEFSIFSAEKKSTVDRKWSFMMLDAMRRWFEVKIAAGFRNFDVGFFSACRTEMIQHRCTLNTSSDDHELSLASLLVCLEDHLKDGKQIEDGCRREMLGFRRMLMSDYALSPDIVVECKSEMTQHCASLYSQGASGTIDQRGGRMIHCLLGAARKDRSFSSGCLAAVKALVRAVDPGNDIRADPLLESTCRSVIDHLCPNVRAGDSNVIMCLLDNLRSPQMKEDCEDRLMEVAYFMARDWR